jgi:hypothetical protein
MGTVWLTPSPESMTMPVVRPEAYSERTAWMATYIAGTLKVSNMICVIFSLQGDEWGRKQEGIFESGH